MLNIKEFHFNQTTDIHSSLVLKSVVVEFSFLTWRDRLSFAWRVLKNKTIKEQSLFSGGATVMSFENRPGTIE